MKTFEVAFKLLPAVCVLQNFSNSSLSQFAKPSIYLLQNVIIRGYQNEKKPALENKILTSLTFPVISEDFMKLS